MEYRLLGRSGFKVPVLTFGTGTFGGKGDFFKAWGDTDAKGAERLVDIMFQGIEQGLRPAHYATGKSAKTKRK